jgi:hypothetical protein
MGRRHPHRSSISVDRPVKPNRPISTWSAIPALEFARPPAESRNRRFDGKGPFSSDRFTPSIVSVYGTYLPTSGSPVPLQPVAP